MLITFKYWVINDLKNIKGGLESIFCFNKPPLVTFVLRLLGVQKRYSC